MAVKSSRLENIETANNRFIISLFFDLLTTIILLLMATGIMGWDFYIENDTVWIDFWTIPLTIFYTWYFMGKIIWIAHTWVDLEEDIKWGLTFYWRLPTNDEMWERTFAEDRK